MLLLLSKLLNLTYETMNSEAETFSASWFIDSDESITDTSNCETVL